MDAVSPSVIGARAEMAVASGLQRAGMDVFVPLFAAHSRVDVIAAGPTGLLRVQCKTARVVPGALFFRTCSNTANIPLDYRDQIDAFGVYSPELDSVYLVPVQDVSIRACHLRIEPTRNHQQAGIRWAADYLIGPP
jgi:hypothetical protein